MLFLPLMADSTAIDPARQDAELLPRKLGEELDLFVRRAGLLLERALEPSVDSTASEKAHVRAATARPEQHDLVLFRSAAFHARRTNRHAGHRQPGRRRL